MTVGDDPDGAHRRAAARLDMVLARANAANDRALGDTAAVAIRSVPFQVLAAEGGARQLPGTITALGDQSLRIGLTEGNGAIELTIEALGFPAIQSVARRLARLASGDGALDYTFRFDNRGRAVLQLSGSDAVRRALSHDFRVDIEG